MTKHNIDRQLTALWSLSVLFVGGHLSINTHQQTAVAPRAQTGGRGLNESSHLVLSYKQQIHKGKGAIHYNLNITPLLLAYLVATVASMTSSWNK